MYELIVESIQFLQLENLIYAFFSPKLFPATQRGRLNNQAYSGFVLKRHVWEERQNQNRLDSERDW